VTASTPYRENPPADVLLDVSDLDEEFARPAPIQPRDGRDRPLIVPRGGGEPVAYQRASTFANVLTDQSGLTTWKIRHAVRGVARNAALTAKAAAHAYGERELDVTIEEGLLLDGATDAANWGTAFHRLTEPDGRSTPVEEIPDEIRADVASYWEAIDAAGLVPVATELFVVNDEYRVAGTFDHVFALPGGAGFVVGDKKTGKLKPREHAVQLAVYAGGELYKDGGDPLAGIGAVDWATSIDDHRRARLNVRQDLALVAHTPHGKGRTDLVWVRLDRGREAIERALWLREWRADNTVALAWEIGLAMLAQAPDVTPGLDLGGPLPPGRSSIVNTTGAPVLVEPFGEGGGFARSAATIRHEIEAERTAERPAPQAPRPAGVPPVGEHETARGPGSREQLLHAVANASSEEEIGRLYQANRNEWDEDVRELARARRALLGNGIV
jgi:hypothetical protein